MSGEYKVETSTLKVQNIGQDVTPRDLRKLFLRLGRVFYVRIHSDYESEYGSEDPRADNT